MDTTIIMPRYVVDWGWGAFAAVNDVLQDRGIKVGQLRFLYAGEPVLAGIPCLTATFAVVRE